MKRYVFLLLAVAMFLQTVLVGCQSNPAQTEPSETATVETQDMTPTDEPEQDTTGEDIVEEEKPLLETQVGPLFDIADNTETEGFPENDPYVREDFSTSGGVYGYTQIPNVVYDPDAELVYVNYNRHRDVVVNYPYDSTRVYKLETLLDAGSGAKLQDDYVDMQTENTMFFTAMAKLQDGRIFCQNYMTYYLTDTTATTYSWIIDADGNWQRIEGRLTIPKELAAKGPQPNSKWHRYAFSRCLEELPDGTLLGSMYGTYGAIMVESRDQGKTWNYRSTIAMSAYGLEQPYINTDGTDITWFEPAVTRCADGSLLCVMRTWRNKPLWQARSYDDGLTWSEPTLMPGVEGMSIYPHLVLLSNGVLAMATGVPGDTIYFSLDGCGYNWDAFITTYSENTTGNAAITEVDYDEATGTVTLLAVGDKGFNNQSLSGVWGRLVKVTRNHVQNPQLEKVTVRIDKTLLRPGDTLQARVDAIFNSDATLVEKDYTVQWSSLAPDRVTVDQTGLITAVDVGTAQLQATVTWGGKTVASNTLTLKVQDDNVLETVDVSVSKWVLKPNEAGHITKVAYNSFGQEMKEGTVSWRFESQDPQLLEVDGKTGSYRALSSGVVDLLVTASRGDVTLTKAITMIVESDRWVKEGFEEGSLPKNCFVTQLVGVSTSCSYSGEWSVYVNDVSDALAPSLRFVMPESKGVIVEFMIYTEKNEHSSTFGVGHPKKNGTYDYTCNTARIGLLYNALTGIQGYQAYDGNAWSKVNRNNIFPHQRWNKVRLEVTADKPYNLYVNDKLVASLPVAAVHETLNTLYFSTGGTSYTGDAYYIDDIRYMIFDEA